MAWEWGEKWWWGVVLGREMQRNNTGRGWGEKGEGGLCLCVYMVVRYFAQKGALYQ